MNIAVLVDIGVVIILLISAGVSFFRGFIREALTILGVLGGGFAALTFGKDFIPYTSNWLGVEEGKDPEKLFDMIPMDVVANVAAYAGIFVAVFLILQLASHLISNAVQAVGLGPVDRTLGIFFGLARGLLLLGILYLPFHFILPEDSKKEWFEKSKTMVFVEATTNWLMSFTPQGQENAQSGEADGTRSKLNSLDILGDKRLTETEKEQSEQKQNADGYSEKARESLDKLIENKMTPPGKAYNE